MGAVSGFAGRQGIEVSGTATHMGRFAWERTPTDRLSTCSKESSPMPLMVWVTDPSVSTTLPTESCRSVVQVYGPVGSRETLI
jgi:hypothetical protein